MTTPRARVEAWIEATRRVTRPHTRGLVDAIARESGLSPPGVKLALDEILEVDRAPAELARFLENSRLTAIGERSCAAVVLSSTVPTAGFRAIAWALAQAPRVVVRPSRRCRALVSAIAAASRDLVDVSAPTHRPEEDLEALVAALPPRGALHVYGGEEATKAARLFTSTRSDLDLELHGPGFGAIVARDVDAIAHARSIAGDVIAFDQRGCLSPRLLLVLGDAPRTADAIHVALEELDHSIPRGTLDDDERSAILLARDAARFGGRVLEGAGHVVLDLSSSADAPVGPIGRVLPVVGVRNVDDAIDRLRPLASMLTRVATTDDLAPRLASLAPTCRLGEMQRPPFDGPVDQRI